MSGHFSPTRSDPKRGVIYYLQNNLVCGVLMNALKEESRHLQKLREIFRKTLLRS